MTGTMTNQQERLWRLMMAKSWEPRQWFFRDDDIFQGMPLPQYADLGSTEERLMWVYRRLDTVELRSEGDARWAVGYYAPDGRWHQDSVHADQDKAAARVHWLNGGGMRA